MAVAVAQTTPHEGVVGELEGSIEVPPGEHGAGFPPFDPTHFASQILWFAITFAILYYLMSKIALPRIGSILEGRRDRIAADLDHAERLKGESADAEETYLKALADARARASEIAEGAREDARSKADARQAEIEADLTKKLETAEKRIADIKAQAMAEVGNIATETSEAVIHALVDVPADTAEVKAAVDEALAARNANA